MTCSSMSGLVSTLLHRLSWDPLPQSDLLFLLLKFLHPVLYNFLFPCFTHSFWKDISTTSCMEDTKKVDFLRTCMSEMPLFYPKITPPPHFQSYLIHLLPEFLWYKLKFTLYAYLFVFGFSYCHLKFHPIGYNNSHIVYLFPFQFPSHMAVIPIFVGLRLFFFFF